MTSATLEIVQLPRGSGATHSWIPYWSGDWLQARRPKHEDVFSESQKSSRALEPCHGGKASVSARWVGR